MKYFVYAVFALSMLIVFLITLGDAGWFWTGVVYGLVVGGLALERFVRRLNEHYGWWF